jgi:hypothetical protein
MKSEVRSERITEAGKLADSVDQIARFSEHNLTSKIAELEFKAVGLDRVQVADWRHTASLDKDLLGPREP